jgi:hypothetical protein
VRLDKWPLWAHGLLLRLPALSDPDVPGVAHDRLYPLPRDDAGHAEEWRRHVHPELFRLLASSREIVARDLAGARLGKAGSLRRMDIPPGHVGGWIAALNAARLRLAAEHGVDAAAMKAAIGDLPEPLREPVATIDFLGWFQQTLVEGADPEAVREPGGA